MANRSKASKKNNWQQTIWKDVQRLNKSWNDTELQIADQLKFTMSECWLTDCFILKLQQQQWWESNLESSAFLLVWTKLQYILCSLNL